MGLSHPTKVTIEQSEVGMTFEHPRFPTPEDELRASLLWQAACKFADSDVDILLTGAKDNEKPAD